MQLESSTFAVCSDDDERISHYTVSLEAANNSVHSRVTADESHCMNGTCSTLIALTQLLLGKYNLSIMAQSLLRNSTSAFFPFFICKALYKMQLHRH